MDFSITFMFLFSLFVLLQSFENANSDKYRRELSKIVPVKNIPFEIIRFNILLMIVISILLYYTTLLFLFIQDVPAYITLTRYLITVLPAICIFAAIGTGIGCIKDKFLKYLILVFFTIVLLILLFWSSNRMVVKDIPARINDRFVMELERRSFNQIDSSFKKQYNDPSNIQQGA